MNKAMLAKAGLRAINLGTMTGAGPGRWDLRGYLKVTKDRKGRLLLWRGGVLIATLKRAESGLLYARADGGRHLYFFVPVLGKRGEYEVKLVVKKSKGK